MLLFNGQVFGGGLAVPPGANDAQLLLGVLAATGAAGVPVVLTGLQGPWALAYWQHATRTLWFGRDPIGGLGWLSVFIVLQQLGEYSTHLPRWCNACCSLLARLQTPQPSPPP